MWRYGASQDTDLSISLLSTSQALRDEIIFYSAAGDVDAMQVDAVHLGGGVQHHPSGSGPLGWDKKGGKGTGKGKDGKKGNSEEKVEKQAVKFEVDRRWSRKKGAQEGGLQDNAGRGRCEKNGKAIGARALGTMGGGGLHPTQTSAVTSMAGSLATTVSCPASAFLFASRVSKCSSPSTGLST